jgi:hypothetical protein
VRGGDQVGVIGFGHAAALAPSGYLIRPA